MDQAVRKATELGVAAIQPLVTARSQPLPSASAATGASSTGGRSWSPPASSAAATGFPPCCRANPRCMARAWTARDPAFAGGDHSFAQLAPPPAPLALVIGPEGGFDSAKWRRCARRLPRGPGRAALLRTETAAVADSPSWQALWGDCDDAIDDGAGHRRGPRRLREPRRLTRTCREPAATLRRRGEEGRAVVRVITAPARARRSTSTVSRGPMDVRAPPGTVPLRPTRSDPSESKPRRSPVLVCEKFVPEGVRRAWVDGRELPLPKANPQRIVVLGDTGCRIKASTARSRRATTGRNGRSRTWPTRRRPPVRTSSSTRATLTTARTHARRATRCAGTPGIRLGRVGGGPLRPARKLLEAAPWIVVRGNHESCSRAGRAGGDSSIRVRWPRARTATTRRTMRSATTANPTRCRLGAGADADTQLIVFDSSLRGCGLWRRPNRCSSGIARSSSALRARGPPARRVLHEHHPILALAANPERPDAPYPGNAALQSVLGAIQPTVLFPPNVQALLAGHFQCSRS